jgi:rubrerythrin
LDTNAEASFRRITPTRGLERKTWIIRSSTKEAVLFYHDLQISAHFTEKRKMLQDLENMEKGHMTILEGIRRKDIEALEIPDVQNLHISDYLVKEETSGELSYQDILIIAMKREESSHRLYGDLAGKSSDEGVKKLFLKLASEEAKHKLIFERIYDEEILTQD